MQLLTLGINHHTTPLSLCEKMAFPLGQLKLTLDTLRQHLPHLRNTTEAAILSTRNRTEIYCATDGNLPEQTAHERAIHWLAQHHNIDPGGLTPRVYSLGQSLAVRHAFRVVSGLDSMVLSETQIPGQVKDTVHTATKTGTLGTCLSQLFQHTFAVAREVRDTTEIGAHFVSMATAAVRLTQCIFGSIADQRILFIGTGRMIELCTAHFAAQAPHEVVTANRTLERGEKPTESLSNQGLNTRVMHLAKLPTRPVEFDTVMSHTANTLPIIGLGAMKRTIRQRRHRLMSMVDLAVPHDIEPEVVRLSDVFLRTVGDLGAIIHEGNALWRAAMAQAEAIIETHVLNFMHWLSAHSMVPIVRDLHTQAETLRQGELERTQHMLTRGDNPALVLETLSRALTEKFLHGPTHALSHAQGEGHERLIDLLPALFRQSSHSERQRPMLHSHAARFHSGT